jgi:hypothetical protein
MPAHQKNQKEINFFFYNSLLLPVLNFTDPKCRKYQSALVQDNLKT